MKKIILLLTLMVFSVKSFAQDEKNPWAVGLGINTVDVNAFRIKDIGDQFKDYLGASDWNTLPVLSRIYVARYLDKGFSVDFTGSINNITKYPVVGPTISTFTSDLVSFTIEDDSRAAEAGQEKTYYSLDLGVRYDLNKLIGETGWFDPYVKAAGGAAWVEDDMAGVFTGALGFNTWFNESVGLNFETAYKSSDVFGDDELGHAQLIGDYHFQHSISLVLRFGKKDADNDGIADKKDDCPEIAGIEAFNGCPDSDGDGVADKDDQCPNLAGTIATKGCPDSDGDGVIDSKDKCPSKAGRFNGCPDSDNDGLADNLDKCPTISGPKANKGCPWPDTDGDGITDNLDKCPKEAGVSSNNGCPAKLSEEAKKKLGKYAKTIQFNSGQDKFKAGVTSTLDAIAKVMKEFSGIKFDVEGHSDSAGNDAKNLALSQRRAQAVVDYLGSHGIDSARLHAVGYGEAKPIATNKTRAGRAINRRVVLTAIEK